MPDPATRLEMLRFARRVAQQHLAQIDQWIADEQQRQHAEPSPPSGWIVVDSWAPTQPPVIHTSTCTEARDAKRARPIVDRSKIMQIFYGGATVCALCNSADTLKEE